MTVAHVLIFDFSSLLCASILGWLFHALTGIDAMHGFRTLLTIGVSMVAALPVSWWLCRLFRVSPLMIFAPSCPHCHEHPPGWWCLEEHPPSGSRMVDRLELACDLCKGKVELHLRRPQAAAVSSEFPSYRVRWPQFLGIWRRLDVAGRADRQST
jgi:hypothetical protein